VLGSYFELGAGTSFSDASRIVARQARKDAASADTPGRESLISLITTPPRVIGSRRRLAVITAATATRPGGRIITPSP
jgi:hypothetical protein